MSAPEENIPLGDDPDDAGLVDKPSWRGLGRELLVGLAVILTVTALGAPLGVVWSALSPRVLVRMTDQGAVLTSAEPEEYMGAEAVFTLLGLGVGIVLGVLGWWALRRWRGPVILISLMIGSLLGACATWQIGQKIGLAEYEDLKRTAQVGWEFFRPPTLETGGVWHIAGVPVFPYGALVAQALGAVFAYTLAAGWSRYRDLRNEDPDESDVESEPGDGELGGVWSDGTEREGRGA
ncbi:MAG: DUF2567 domain-containing protein [Longispora sp.]|nr:DUF2567 domain-containing protein [Longispora sp. (in: high G+C Gram-positive bacteria)]